MSRIDRSLRAIAVGRVSNLWVFNFISQQQAKTWIFMGAAWLQPAKRESSQPGDHVLPKFIITSTNPKVIAISAGVVSLSSRKKIKGTWSSRFTEKSRFFSQSAEKSALQSSPPSDYGVTSRVSP
jgi:hypothetical protein